MNKQELIDQYKNYENVLDDIGARVVCKHFLKDLEQLDEPEKVKVPQLIAEKIEYCKETDGYSLFHAMDYCYNFKECADWLESNEEVFARAWLDGYEVEKEKQYLVKVKVTGQCLGKYYINNEILSPRFIYTGRNADSFTRKELEEADFGWVFDCEGIDIEEVND